MKSSEIKIDTELNEELWKRGITKPPRRITVKMEKDEDGVVTISLPKKAKKETEIVAPEEESVKSEPAAEEKKAVPVADELKASTPPDTPKEKPRKSPKKAAPKKKAKKSKS
jgi:hypothetical protein